jgi:hypothetical protein
VIRLALFILGLIFTVTSVYADDVKFTASAPSEVEVGDKFQVRFQVNTTEVSNFSAPNFKGFEVLYGPSTSTSSSYQIINGRATSNSSITYTFTLLCEKAGTHVINGASVVVDGKTVKSNDVTVKVHSLGNGASSQPNNPGGASRMQTTRPVTTGGNIKSTDLFMTATANKTKVYEQEAVILTYKIYTLVNLTQLDGKLPSLDGFQIQEIPLPRQKQFNIEEYNGRNYRTVVWSQYLLFPQKSGKFVIPSITYEGVVQEINPNIDPFEAFFNGTGGVMDFKKKLTTPQVTIDVQALPEKAEGFSGAVGKFDISSSINTTELKTNEAINLKVKISGSGNMKLIGTPEVKFPADFENYDPKITDQFSNSSSGLSGYREFDFLAVPRSHGTFTIPPIEFVYFDPSAKSYKTVKTEPYNINVAKGQGGSNSTVADFSSTQRTVDNIGADIRYIKRGETSLRSDKEVFFGTRNYWLCYVGALFIFALVVFFTNKIRKANANVVAAMERKANKIATKRLKLSASLLKQRKQTEFYEEVLKALWGYIANKLNMPLEQLNKDNIQSQLEERGVDQMLIAEFIDLLNRCEYARYAPNSGGMSMESVYGSAVKVISKMENKIKGRKTN